MAHTFSNHTMTNGKFGPTPNGHFYMPMAYHNPSAIKRRDKTRWVLSQDQQYEVFEIADTPIDEVPCWMNDDKSGLFGMLDGCEVVLGKDNEERLAFFPTPSNDSDPWHGYPTDSMNLGDDLINFWFEKKLISKIVYGRLMRHEL